MLDLDARMLTEALGRVLGVCGDLGEIAAQAEGEALGHAILGLRRNVYDTTPGAYVRTQDLLRGLQSSSTSSTNLASVTVRNTEPYALYVELGQGAGGLSVQQDQAIAAASTDPANPLSFGRSGRNYTVAGPFIAPAQFYALHRMAELFGQKITRAT